MRAYIGVYNICKMENIFILCLTVLIGVVLGEIPTNKSDECSNPFYKVGEKCLHFGNFDFLEVNHSQAVDYCCDIGGSLVMIQTPTQFKDIIDYINTKNIVDEYWIDGSDAKQEGKWVFQNEELVPMGTPFWYAYGNDEKWFQEPNDASGIFELSEDCMVMDHKPTFYMNDIQCNVTNRRPLCEESFGTDDKQLFQLDHISFRADYLTETTLTCPVPYVPVGDTCLAFLFYTATMTWPEAVLTCETMAGTLAQIDDPELLRAVYLYLHEHEISEESFWLGGSDRDEEGVWVWLDGTPVPRGPPMWGFFAGQEQPVTDASINCLGLLSDGFHFFRDDNCEDNTIYKPICMPLDNLE